VFNLTNYRRLLEDALQAGYKFISFDGSLLSNRFLDANLCCLLRHDVDADLQAAFNMAQLEKSLGISSTYFLMLRSPLYNLMGRRNMIYAEKLLELGHQIGLHYDQGFDLHRGFSPDRTSANIAMEASILEGQFACKVTAVSFHQPKPSVLQGALSTGSLLNTYDHDLLRRFSYFSDSNRKFSLCEDTETDISHALSKLAPANVQVLIHPMWWVYDDEGTHAVWDRAILSNFELMQSQLLETERAYGGPRVFRITGE
jgi:hypothetical protein